MVFDRPLGARRRADAGRVAERGVYPLSSPASNRKARSASRRGSMGPSSWPWPVSRRCAALGAQAGAVGLAQGRDRLLEADRLGDERPQLQLVVIGEARAPPGRHPPRAGPAAPLARSIDGRTSSSIRSRTGVRTGRRHRAHSPAIVVLQLRRDDQAAVRAREAHAAVHGLGQHDALAGVDGHALDHVVADGAGHVGHQPGHGERERIPVGVHGVAVRARAGHRRAAVEAPSAASSSSSP